MLAAARMHDHALGHQRARIEAAERLDAHEATLIHIARHEADLVHMRRQHHLAVAGAAFDGDHVAQRVHRKLIHQRLQLLDDDGAHLLLAARDARRLAQPPQQIEVDCTRRR